MLVNLLRRGREYVRDVVVVRHPIATILADHHKKFAVGEQDDIILLSFEHYLSTLFKTQRSGANSAVLIESSGNNANMTNVRAFFAGEVFVQALL